MTKVKFGGSPKYQQGKTWRFDQIWQWLSLEAYPNITKVPLGGFPNMAKVKLGGSLKYDIIARFHPYTFDKFLSWEGLNLLFLFFRFWSITQRKASWMWLLWLYRANNQTCPFCRLRIINTTHLSLLSFSDFVPEKQCNEPVAEWDCTLQWLLLQKYVQVSFCRTGKMAVLK